ncbi:MAG: hypothetical protein JWO94_1870 [Verrucomicrobiaceae bacterium]|nr:hypothetical protein [Verrucomicrobiaceae bacterium]
MCPRQISPGQRTSTVESEASPFRRRTNWRLSLAGSRLSFLVIYLDSNATSPVDPQVLEAMLPFLRELFANPGASYRPARQVQKAVRTARAQVAGLLDVSDEEIIFTSGGTESNNTAIEAARMFWPRRKHLVIGATEHPAVLEPAKRWEKDGGSVTIVPVQADGVISLDALREAVRPDETALVSVMWANNETGVIAPIEAIGHIARSAGALMHTDAVQAVGKLGISLRSLPIDYLSLSGHKFHAPKGVGALYVSKHARFRPLLLGGGQEGGRRSGTENVPGIVALGAAAAMAPADPSLIAAMRDDFEARVRTALPDTVMNGHPWQRLPGTTNLCFPGLSAVEMLILLDDRGVCCAAGSACHTAHVHPSPVLEAMGFDAAHAAGSLRFSFSRLNTIKEAAEATAHVVAVAGRLRQFQGDGSSPVILG